VPNNLILCLETATEICSVALSREGVCIGEKSISEPNSHGSMLTVLMEDLLKEHEVKFTDLSAVAYSQGPGSYTGLRIGLSVAKGICYGANIPLLSISTLQHIAATQQGRFCFPMIDARRMEVYGALFNPLNECILLPFACIVDQYNWQELLGDQPICFLGNGMLKSKKILGAFPQAVFEETYKISANSMCSLAHQQFLRQDFASLAYHVPFYLKEANVTEAKNKALG
jgi:tRNA threonylcarbamoyladenosine biosynthesis protein TsaB